MLEFQESNGINISVIPEEEPGVSRLPATRLTQSAGEMFDLRRWLASVDTSIADASLNDEAAQLLILNDSLVDEGSGPILASLIVSTEGDHGLEAFVDLAKGSEPRFVAMALLNILYILRMERSEDCEFSYRPDNASSSQEITITVNDLPSEDFVRTRIASVMHGISLVFLEKVSEGDFCPDFLIYLLTILMDLSKDCARSPEIALFLARIPSVQFLKAVVRTWKNPDLAAHVSTAEPGDESGDNLALGFLVSCYLRCVCITSAPSSREEPHAVPENRAPEGELVDEEYGVGAIIAMDDWFIKFALMRIYQEDSRLSEVEFLISVLHECIRRQDSFGEQLVRLQFGSALLHSLKVWHESSEGTAEAIPEVVCSRDVKSMWQYFHIMRDLSGLLQFGNTGNEFDETMHRASEIWFATIWDSLKILVILAFSVLIGTDFGAQPSTSGVPLKKSISSLILKTASLAWRVRNTQLSSHATRARRARVKSRFKNWSICIEAEVASCLRRQGTSWERLSRSRDLDAVCRSLSICKGFSEERPSIVSEQWGSSEYVCEWCLERNTSSKLCGTCHRVWYCSAAHQRAHWQAGHRTECAFVRNSLEGCSFTLEENGEISGLIALERREETMGTVWNEGAEFCEVEKGQRDELVFLGYRLPGVFLNVYYSDGSGVGGVRYLTRGEFAAEMKESSYDSEGDETRRWLSVCVKNSERNIRMHIIDMIPTGRRQIRIHFYGFDETHSLVT